MPELWELDRYGDEPAVIDEHGRAITYAELKKYSEEVSEAVGRRCLVFSLCQNEIGSVIGYVGFMNGGIPPVLLNSHLDSELLDGLLSVYEPSFIWLPSDQRERFPDMEQVYECFDYVLVRTGYKTDHQLYSELGLLLTTSGSTGSPKLVRQSYENVLDNARAIAEYLHLDSTERPISTLPMNYTYGLSIINSHLLVGAVLLMTEKTLMQKDFWSFFDEQRATSFGGVPYTYEMLDKLKFYRKELPSLRYMTQAGGKLLPDLHEKFAMYAQETGKKFIVMYGQCEATARMGYLPPERTVEKKGSMGIAIPGGKFRLIDAEGKEIHEPFTVGELVYEGRNVTLGYAETAKDLAKGDERGGILETGDMAQFDEDGYYYIVGRKKRFLKIYGNRVNLDEIDRLIKGRFSIEVASAGVDDHLYIFVTDEKYVDQAKDFVVSKTKLNPAAFKVMAIDSIPKNDSGKTLYKELAKYYEG